MSLLCCCRDRKLPPSNPRASTPEAALPARPNPVKLSGAPFSGSSTKAKVVATNPPEAPSRIRTPMKHPVVDLSILEVEDSDDGNDDGDDGGLGSAKHSSSSTLEVLKAKFIRRLSQVSENSNGSRRTRTPCSEGELARRAELKRLRQKRIKEELKEEQEAEEKAKTRADRAISDQLDTELSGGGPRDAIECNLAESEGPKPNYTLPRDPPKHPKTENAVKLARRRRSISDVGSHDRLSSTGDKSLREYRSLPDMPQSPRLQPVYLPSIYSSNSIVSWRLSNSDGNFIGSLKQSMNSTSRVSIREPIKEKECESIAVTPKSLGRKLVSSTDSNVEQEKALAPGTNEQNINDDNVLASSIRGTASASFDMGNNDSVHTTNGRSSPLDIWLQTQGLELPRCSTSDLGASMTCPIDDIKSDAPSSNIYHGQSSGIPLLQPKTSHIRGLFIGFDTPESGSTTQEAASGVGSSLVASDKRQNREITRDSSEEDLGIYLRKSFSSHYTAQSSNPRSPRPPPATMTPNSVMYRGIYITHPTPEVPGSSGRTSNNDGSDASSYKTAPIESAKLVPATEVNIASLRRPTDETMSSMLSGTESFKQREAELLSVAKRFAGVDAGRYEGNHNVSKFREEFDMPKKTKPAILKRLHIPKMTKSSRRKRNKPVPPHQDRHRNCVAAALDASQTAAAGPNASLVPSNAANQAPRNRTHGIPESATNVWQRAVKLEADRRELLGKDKDTSHSSSKPEFSHEERPLSTPVFPLRSSTPPKSWARWPSHTRPARNGPAQQNDSIRPQDFAVAQSHTGETRCSTDQDSAAPTEPKERSDSLSGKVTKAIRKSIARIMPNGDYNLSPALSFAAGSAQNGKPGGHLEYPELELLPMAGGYKELEALESQIEHIKNLSETRSPPVTSPNRSPRLTLSQRLAEEVHRFQHGDRARSPDINDHLKTLPPPRLSTPVRMQLTPRVVSEVTTHYETPRSHMSYEDCVPKHMLDDDGSSKSDNSGNVKRSLSNVEHKNLGQVKYETWSGRTKAGHVLRKSTHEFGVELEKLLERERDKALDVGAKRDGAKSPGGSNHVTTNP
ncbi:hypothetical protein PG999_002164 [Apiospora kogelbergensis]|uniref:Uncharacterized protein n=1 Tax=Apiospora kogelbergensis TaxID=1337665 RepID=A0AAW0R7L3_9PEZI